MSLRSSELHVLLALSLMGSPAAAQDIRGMEACGAEKQMDRRTGCLQANVEFLQQELVKLRRETQAQVAAAKAEARAETKAQSDALKAALTKLEAELAQVKAKTEPKVEKKQ
jgi:hypothetical protein